MPHYRAYFLQPDNSIGSAIDIDAADDAHAVEILTGMGAADPIEVWTGTRRIGRVEPAAPTDLPQTASEGSATNEEKPRR